MKVSTLHFLAFRKYLSMEVGVKCIFGRVARVSGVVVANKLVARSTDDRLSVHSSISGCWRVWRLVVTIISFCYVNTALTNFLIILAHRREVELSTFLGYLSHLIVSMSLSVESRTNQRIQILSSLLIRPKIICYQLKKRGWGQLYSPKRYHL